MNLIVTRALTPCILSRRSNYALIYATLRIKSTLTLDYWHLIYINQSPKSFSKFYFQSKRLEGDWAELYDHDAQGPERKPPCVVVYDDCDESNRKVKHTLTLEQVRFPDKSFLHHDNVLNITIKKEKHQFEFDSPQNKVKCVYMYWKLKIEKKKFKIALY